MTACQRRIGALWWLVYTDHGDGTCTIHALGRDDNHNAVGPWFAVREQDPGRTVIAVVLGEREGVMGPDESHPSAHTLIVRNPRHIFSYSKED